MQVSSSNIALVIIVATLLAVILALFFIILLVVFQKTIKKKNEELYQAIIDIQEEERQRIGRDLHDDIGPLLSALKLELEDLEGKHHTEKLINKAIASIRIASHNLFPRVIQTQGLQGALSNLCDSFHYNGKPAVIFQASVAAVPSIKQSNSLHIYRIVAELLNNAFKHGKATEVLVQYVATGKDLSLKIIDNGIGMTVKPEESPGMGWQNIINRLTIIGGTYSIESGADVGTFISLYFPLAKL